MVNQIEKAARWESTWPIATPILTKHIRFLTCLLEKRCKCDFFIGFFQVWVTGVLTVVAAACHHLFNEMGELTHSFQIPRTCRLLDIILVINLPMLRSGLNSPIFAAWWQYGTVSACRTIDVKLDQNHKLTVFQNDVKLRRIGVFQTSTQLD
jgi:hypothetical protein